MQIIHLDLSEAAFLNDFDLLGVPNDYVLSHLNAKLKLYPCRKNIRGYFNAWWGEHQKRVLNAYLNMQGEAEYKRIQEEERVQRIRIQTAKDIMYLNFCKKRGLDPETQAAGNAFYLEVIAKQ